MVRIVVTPLSDETAVAAVERMAGVRPESSEWELGYWLLGTPTAVGRRRRISTEHRRWVAVPGVGCQEVAKGADTELVGAHLVAAGGIFQLTVRPRFAWVVLTWWAVFLALDAAARLLTGLGDWGGIVWLPIASTLVMLGGILLHELGHVTAAVAMRNRWIGLRLDGDGMAVQFWPVVQRGWRCVVRSLSGPAVHLTYSMLLVLPGIGQGVVLQQRMLLMPATLGTILALMQLAPVPGMDGWRAMKGIRGARHRPSK